jgi:hypothetical protein
MDIPPFSPANPAHFSPNSFNLPALKQELKTTLGHLNHTLNTLLQNPDTLNAALCQDLSTSVLHVHQMGQSITQQDSQSVLTETATLILTILEAPVYV